MNAKDKRFNHSVDSSNRLERAIDLLHVQDVILNQMVGNANEAHNHRRELLLDDIISLNHVIIEQIDKPANTIMNKAIARLNQ